MTAWCGDGETDTGEECDDGEDNADDEPDACRSHCAFAWCGDGVVDTGEECDDGEDNSDDEPDACRLDCDAPVCGDGVTDIGEACDLGVLNGGDDCGFDCLVPSAEPDAGSDVGDADVDTGGSGSAGGRVRGGGGLCAMSSGQPSTAWALAGLLLGLAATRRRRL